MFGQDKKEHGEKTEVALVCMYTRSVEFEAFNLWNFARMCSRGGEALKNIMILIRFREYDSILIQPKAVD